MKLRFKAVMRRDPDARLFRVGRTAWTRGEGPGVGGRWNYDASISVALCRSLFGFRRETDGWIVRLMFVRIHYQRSYGGRIA